MLTILGINVFGDVSIFRGNQTDATPINDEKASTSYCRGIIHDKSWESKFIGLRYTAPEGMSMLTAEELDGLIELDRENLSKMFNQNQLGYISLTTVFEMLSMTDDQRTSVGICAERLFSEVNISQGVEILKSLFSQHPYINYTLVSDNETVKIGNEYYNKISYSMEFNNVLLYMDNYIRIVGDRAIMISLIYDDETARNNVLDAFTAY